MLLVARPPATQRLDDSRAHLPLETHRVVITNSSDIARTLATVNGNKIYMAGREIRSDGVAALGFSAIEFMSRFSVDDAIISTGAVHADSGIMDYDLAEAEFARTVLACGRRRLVVTDHTEFGAEGTGAGLRVRRHTDSVYRQTAAG